MAHNIITVSGSRFYTIEYDQALNWNSANAFPYGMYLMAIDLIITNAADSLIIRDGADGPVIFGHSATLGWTKLFRAYEVSTPKGRRGVHCRPYIHAAEAVGVFTVTFQLA